MNVIFRCGRITFAAVLLLVGHVQVAHSQRLAVIAPDHSPMDEKFAGLIAESLAKHFTVADMALADTAFRSLSLAAPFNLSLAD